MLIKIPVHKIIYITKMYLGTLYPSTRIIMYSSKICLNLI